MIDKHEIFIHSNCIERENPDNYFKKPIKTRTVQILNGSETNLNDVDESITILTVSKIKLLLNNNSISIFSLASEIIF